MASVEELLDCWVLGAQHSKPWDALTGSLGLCVYGRTRDSRASEISQTLLRCRSIKIIEASLTTASIAVSMTWIQRSTSFVRLKSVSTPLCKRCLATSASSAPFQVFNTETKRHQRNRAATLDPGTSRRTDYLRDEVATRLVERFMVLHPMCRTN